MHVSLEHLNYYLAWIDEGRVDAAAPGDEPLPLYREVHDYADAFDLDVDSEGAAQLALAMLCHEVGGRRALKLVDAFLNEEFLERKSRSWCFTPERITSWVEANKKLCRLEKYF